MIDVIHQNPIGLELRAHGVITRDDYRRVLPLAKMMIRERGHFSVVVDVRDVRRLTVGAIWEDAKFDVAYFRATKRIAYIGERSAWLYLTSRPFTTDGVRFFAKSELQAARQWAFAD